MNAVCEKLSDAPLRSVHEPRGLTLSGGPEGQVASPTTSLESGGAPKTRAARRPVVGDAPPADLARQIRARERGVYRAPVGLSYAAPSRCLSRLAQESEHGRVVAGREAPE